MITEIDHIVFSSLNIKRDIDKYISEGYKLQFNEILPNLSIKKKFLSNYQKKHELALLKNKNGYNTELSDHGTITKNEGYITLELPNSIIIKTDDIEASKTFWRYFGFKETNDFYFNQY